MAQLPDPVETLDAFGKKLYEEMVKTRGRIDGMYRTLLNHPHLVEKISALGGFLRFQGALPGDVREFIILLSAHERGAEYEWIKHMQPAKESGLPQEIIEAIKGGGMQFPGKYQKIAELTWQILRTSSSIDATLQKGLIKEYGMEGLIEMVILPGFYSMISNVLCAFDIPLPRED